MAVRENIAARGGDCGGTGPQSEKNRAYQKLFAHSFQQFRQDYPGKTPLF